MLSRYGDEIEVDLRWRGVDMLDLWRGTLSPRTLLNLIDHLPRTSHFQEAMAQDDEIVDGLVDLPDGQPSPPPLTEFSPEVELLAAVVDRLGDLGSTIIASNGGKPRNSRPWPRPVTAMDRHRARLRRRAPDELAARLFPTDRGPGA